MLTRVSPDDLRSVDASPAFVRAADASFPRPIPNALEFNAPVHGNWNIVHTGMLVPEAHQVYVCADNCLRGVILTAAEMGASQRFSSVAIEEADLYQDNLETVTIEGGATCTASLSAASRTSSSCAAGWTPSCRRRA